MSILVKQQFSEIPSSSSFHELAETSQIYQSHFVKLLTQKVVSDASLPPENLEALRIHFANFQQKDWTPKILDASRQQELLHGSPGLQGGLPFSGVHLEGQPLTLKFPEPTFETIGSFKDNTLLRDGMIYVDIWTKLVDSRPKDIHDFVYFRKKLLVALEIQAQAGGDSWFEGTPLEPVLVLRVTPKKYCFRLHISGELPLKKLNEDSCLISDSSTPSPDLAFCLLRDSKLKDKLSITPDIREGILLLKIFFRHKGVFSLNFRPFYLKLLCLHVIASRKLSNTTSGFQIFKAVLNLLDTFDFAQHRLIFGLPTLVPRSLLPVEFYDAAATYNYFHQVSIWEILDVQRHAREGLKLLEANEMDKLFTKDDMSLQDAYFVIHSSRVGADQFIFLMDQALGPFVRQWTRRKSVNFLKVPATHEVIGLCYDVSHAPPALIKGPELRDTQGTQAFVDFWRSAVETRRFKDGSIRSCVAFQQPTRQACDPLFLETPESPSILTQIVNHLKAEYFGDGEVQMCHAPLGLFLPLKSVKNEASELTTFLSQVQQLPVALGQSHLLRRTDTQEEDDEGHLRWVQPIAIELQANKKYPTTTQAMEAVKAALLLQIKSNIQLSLKYRAEIFADFENPSFLDVFYPTTIFRISLLAPHGNQTPKLKWEAEICKLIEGLKLRYPAMGATLCLCQDWCDVRYFSASPFLVEHLVAHIFLTHWVDTPHLGFLRFLNLLLTHDFQKTPLYVDYHQDMDHEALLLANSAFEKSTKRPFVCSSLDGTSEFLEIHGDLSFLVSEASRCYSLFLEGPIDGSTLKEQMFYQIAKTGDLKLILHRKVSNKLVSESVVDLYLSTLRARFSCLAGFHYSKVSHVINVTYLPGVLEPKYSSQFIRDIPMILRPDPDGRLSSYPNCALIVEQFIKLSQGLVKKTQENFS